MGYSFRLTARVLLYGQAFVTPVVEHWLECILIVNGSLTKMMYKDDDVV